ncbi:NADH:ubiquinone reductase (Na(+)-transporting) subunit B [Verrucomicrobiota bacterium]
MKFLLKINDKIKPLFAKGGKLEKLEPLFEAGDAFTFTSPAVTDKGTHVRDAADMKRIMVTVIYAVLPCFFFGVWNAGHQYNLANIGASTGFIADILRGLFIVMPIVIVSYGVGGFWEVMFACIKKHEINEGLLVTGLLFPLILPPTIPLWQVAVGISFGVVIGKEIFGGTGMNIVNPALMSRAFLFFAYSQYMVGDVWIALKSGGELVDGVTTATPLGILLDMPKDATAVNMLSNAGYTFKSMLIGNMPGSIGETSAIACLIGAVILLITGVGSWRIMLSCVIGLLGTGLLFNLTGNSTIPPHYHLVMGGFAFGAFFMATDPVSAAATNIGKWIYGFMIGMLIVIIRVANPAFPEGVMLSILFMNIVAPLIDHYVVAAHIRRRTIHG